MAYWLAQLCIQLKIKENLEKYTKNKFNVYSLLTYNSRSETLSKILRAS